MNVVGIIAARMGSSRFPGKPLKNICDIPMLGHVYFRSQKSKLLSSLYVATCDNEIQKYIKSINGNCIITSKKHERASDRVAEALLKIEKQTSKKINIVVLIQGDEPLVTPKMIDKSIKPLLMDKNIEVTNLIQKITSKKNFHDPNEIKVVFDNNYNAIYFSRSPIPHTQSKKNISNTLGFKQVCIIPFKRNTLIEYINLKQTKLEKIESIDMNRLIENEKKIKLILTNDKTYAVDTLKDLKFVERIMNKDKLYNEYKNKI